MRPEILFPLFARASSLPGIGPRLEKLVERLAGPHVADLLWHLPSGLIDRRFRPPIAEVKDGEIATVNVTVGLHVPPPGRNKRVPYRVWVSDETGEMPLIFFHARTDYLQRVLPEGEKRLISGRIDFYQGSPQMTHPDHIVEPEKEAELPLIEATYPLTQGLPQKQLQKASHAAVERVPELPEWNDPAWQQKNAWPGWLAGLKAAHAPESLADLEPDNPARARLAYDELLSNQLALALVRRRLRARETGIDQADGLAPLHLQAVEDGTAALGRLGQRHHGFVVLPQLDLDQELFARDEEQSEDRNDEDRQDFYANTTQKCTHGGGFLSGSVRKHIESSRQFVRYIS